MHEETPPPIPLPPAAQSPYPAHPAPHPASHRPPPPPPPGIGLLGAALIGGAVAAAVGALIAFPLWRRRTEAQPPKRGGRPRKPR